MTKAQLIAELEKWADKCPKQPTHNMEVREAWFRWSNEFKEILSRAKSEPEQEPLAVLADRIGAGRIAIGRSSVNNDWAIEIGGGFKWFYGLTYSEAESKAREYLNGLEDVK